MACDLPLVIWDPLPARPRIRLANDKAAELCGIPLREVVGCAISDLLEPSDDVNIVEEALRSDAVHGIHGADVLVRADRERVPISWWTRTIEVDRRRECVSIVVPTGEVARLGRDPGQPWRDLAPVAVGRANGRWQVESVSRDADGLFGESAGQLIGRSLLQLAHPDDTSRLAALEAAGPEQARSICRARFRHWASGWVDCCLLVGPRTDRHQGLSFAMIGPPTDRPRDRDRLADLERRLRRIGAEVRAAGLLDSVQGVPSAAEFPQLAELSTRQREILSRLLEGDRVRTIAAALYVSQSTVRNHLAAIFAKFGVHSQPELLVLLHGRSKQSVSVNGR